MIRSSRLLLTMLLFCPFWLVPAQAASTNPQALLHLLDYIGVDYPDTVENGKVVNHGEYAEQLEFTRRAVDLIAQLPPGAARTAVQAQAEQLLQLLSEHADGTKVATLTAIMRTDLIRAFNVVTVPRKTPDLARAATLFADNCSSCHGATGLGDGPIALGLEPAPTNFQERARADQRSLYGLYSTITLGVADTAMRNFSQLSDADRWALAFYVGGLAYPYQNKPVEGTFASKPATLTRFDLETLTRLTPAEARESYGENGLVSLTTLRHQPAAAFSQQAPLDIAIERLNESRAAYHQNQYETAYKLALSAYLDGFELAEATLRATDPNGVKALEAEMMQYRKLLKDGAEITQVDGQHAKLILALREVRDRTASTQLDAGIAMGSAYIILVREGLEALLVLAAIIGILIKTGRRDALPYVHAGWISALALGVATWAASAYLVDISGASRELTEGGTALLAVLVLLYVGFWLHDKSHAGQWQAFVKKRIHGALNGRALWALSAVAFLAVYREVFETVLFYQALWLQTEQGGQPMLLSGVAMAAVTLLVVGWVILKSSMRLPLSLFFRVNAVIMFTLALIFTGHGIAGLQTAGILPQTSLPLPAIEWLGIYPNLESYGAQALVIALVILLTSRSRSQPASAHSPT